MALIGPSSPGTMSGGSCPALAIRSRPVVTSSTPAIAVMNRPLRISSTRIRFVRSSASAGPGEASSAAWITGRAKAISIPAPIPLPVTSAMTTPIGRRRRCTLEQLEEVAADLAGRLVVARQVVARHDRSAERHEAALCESRLGQLGRQRAVVGFGQLPEPGGQCVER